MPDADVKQPEGDLVVATPLVRRRAAALGAELSEVRPSGPGGRITLRDLTRTFGTLPASVMPLVADGPSSVHASSAVRRLAAEHGVDLGAVSGSGPGGRVRRADVLQAATGSTAPPGARTGTAPRRGQTESLPPRPVLAPLGETAQLTSVVEVDLTNVVKAPRHEASGSGASSRPGHLLPYLGEAVAAALLEHPAINATLDLTAGQVRYHADLNLGLSIGFADEDPLVIPEASTADSASLAMALGSRRPQHESGSEVATFTLTATDSDVLFETSLLPRGHTATLLVGAVRKQPRVVKDALAAEVIAVRHCAFFSLTYDHSLVDGAEAGRFLTNVRGRLEQATFSS